jgi:hypothetical protein
MAHRIGEILLERGLISRDQLDRALSLQRRWGTRLGVCLVRLGFIEERSLASSLTEQIGVPLAPPSFLDEIPSEVIRRVPGHVAVKHKLIPIRSEGKELHVCLADPQNLFRLDDIAFSLGCKIRPFLATESLIERALAQYYPLAASSETGDLPIEGIDAWLRPVPAPAWRPEVPPVTGATPRETPGPPPLAAPAAPEPIEAAPQVTDPMPSVDEPPEPIDVMHTSSASGQLAATTRQQNALRALARALTAAREERAASATIIQPPEPPPPAPPPLLHDRERERPAESISSADRRSEPPSPYAVLATATSRQDVVSAACGFFGEIFPSTCVLEMAGASARCLAFRRQGEPLSDGSALPRVPCDHTGWLREVLARPIVTILDHVGDPQLRALVEGVGLRPERLSVAPVMDGGNLSLLILGQGLPESEVKPQAARLMRYVQAASDALRMVTLREHILGRARADAVERTSSNQVARRHLDFSGSCADPRLGEPPRGGR